MKGYVIMNELGNYPLYVCLSKEQAENMVREINISCYVLETQVIEEKPQSKPSSIPSHSMLQVC